jgi:putative hemolysin
VQNFPRASLIVVAALLMAACVPVPPAPAGVGAAGPTTSAALVATPATPAETATGAAPTTATPGSQIANPAAVYCVQKGGRLAIVTDAHGESGICIFSDGSQCDEWAYFRGECAPGQSAATGARPTGETPIEATPTPTPAAAQPAPAVDSAAALQNGQYELPDIGGFQLQDGKYEHKTGSGATELVQVGLGKTAAGDLNGDGANDAAAELWANTGGSGVFEYLVALLDQGGSLRQSAATLLGDRVKVQSMEVQGGGKIVISLLAPKDSDPACCPSQLVTRTYELKDGALNLVSETPATPAP